MKKSALYQSLRASAVPVPGRSGCYSVVSPRLQFLPLDSPLLPLARREMQVLGDAIAAAPGYAKLLMHMLNRREAVDSSQIEGTHTRFIPPPATEVPPLMEDLVARIGYEPSEESAIQINILGRVPFIHAQFESIHPFVDGNGRVGRILIPLMFLAEGEPPLHMASFLKVRQHEYYDVLLEVQMHLQWAAWSQLFLECVIASCRHTVHLLAELSKLSDRWGQALKGKQNRSRAFQSHEVMNLLYTGIDAVLDDVATLRNYGPDARKTR